MKNLLAVMIVLLFGSTLMANDIIIIPQNSVPAIQVIAPPAIPPKPIFATPIRDSIWRAKVVTQQRVWYNRYYRYKRLESMLGPQYIIVPQQYRTISTPVLIVK